MTLLCFFLFALFSFLSRPVSCELYSEGLSNSLDPLIAVSDALPKAAIVDSVFAYYLHKGSQAFPINLNSPKPSTPERIRSMVYDNQVDFALTTSGLSLTDELAHPNVKLFPFLAVALVPVYRIDGLSSSLTLSRSLLVKIFLGEIKNWNDQRVKAENPYISLPNLPISVILDSVQSGFANDQTKTFVNALKKFDPSVSTVLGDPSDPSFTVPRWPTANYSSFRFTDSDQIQAVASEVLILNGAIGISDLGTAIQLNAPVAKMINRAGNLVSASHISVGFAVEALATANRARQTQTMDLNDAESASAWPIVIMNYFLLDLSQSRNSCFVRQRVVGFWIWYYTSSAVEDLAAASSAALMPSMVLSELEILDTLRNDVLCHGRPISTEATNSALSVVVNPYFRLVGSLLFKIFENGPTNQAIGAHSISLGIDQSSKTFSRMFHNEMDLGLAFIDDEVDQNAVRLMRESGSHLILPQMLISITPSFNPQLTPMFTVAADYNILLRWETQAKIWLGAITNWNHPEILDKNPTMAASLPLYDGISAPITLIYACAGTGRNMYMQTMMAKTLKHFSAYWNAILYRYPDVDPMKDWCTIEKLKVYTNSSMRIVKASDERMLLALTNSLIGAMSVTYDTLGDRVTGQTATWGSTPFKEGQRVAAYGPAGSLDPVSLPDSQSDRYQTNAIPARECIRSGGLNMETFEYNPLVVDSICWPLTRVLYSISPASYSGSEQCNMGNVTLSLLHWLSTNGDIDLSLQTSTVQLVRLTSLDFVQQAVYKKLSNVKCDGETLLIIQPIVWSLASFATDFGYALGTIGFVLAAVASFILIRYRTNPIFRSASPPMLGLSLFGICLLFASIFPLATNPTASSCSSFFWLINVGFTITFAPLISKTYRIYRIFKQQKLKVLKITNKQLFAFIGLITSFDILLLLLWQTVSSFEPVLTSEISGSPPRDHHYYQCGIQGDAKPYFALLTATKAVLLFFGSAMAFQTRKASSNFNESASISISIFSILICVILIGPIIYFIQAKGDVLVFLLMFFLIWLSFATLIILFFPKVQLVFSSNQAVLDFQSDNHSSRRISNGFSMLDCDKMTLPILLKYITVLKEQLQGAQDRKQRLEMELNQTGESGVKQTDRSASESSATHSSMSRSSSTTTGSSRSLGSGLGKPLVRSKVVPSSSSYAGTPSAVNTSGLGSSPGEAAILAPSNNSHDPGQPPSASAQAVGTGSLKRRPAKTVEFTAIPSSTDSSSVPPRPPRAAEVDASSTAGPSSSVVSSSPSDGHSRSSSSAFLPVESASVKTI